MSKSNSVGTQLTMNKKIIGSLKSIDGIEVSADVIDTTTLDNTTGYKDKIPGFKDVGNISLSGLLDGAIKFPAGIGKTWSFKASVVKFKTGAQVGDAISFDAELAVSGKPTLAASTDASV